MLHSVQNTTLIVVFMALLTGCTATHKVGQKPNAKRDLIVFVGERLSVTAQPIEPDSMDEKFEARYRVLKLVFGRYQASEITFTVYDHYGSPPFAKYDT